MLIAEVCALVDRWQALEAELFARAGDAVRATGEPGPRVALAEISRHAGARALRWAALRPVVPIPPTDLEPVIGGPLELLERLVAEYGSAMRDAEPASDGAVLAALRLASLEAAGDRRRLAG